MRAVKNKISIILLGLTFVSLSYVFLAMKKSKHDLEFKVNSLVKKIDQSNLMLFQPK